MADSPGTIEDMLGEMLRLMRSMNAMMEKKHGERAAAKDETRDSQLHDASGTTIPATPLACNKISSVLKEATQPSRVSDKRKDGTRASGSATVVGTLLRIVDALKEVGLIPAEESDEKKTSPLGKRRFGLNINQAQRMNGKEFTLNCDWF